MKENIAVEKFREFVTTLSSSIMLVVLFGLFAMVLIYHTFIANLSTIGTDNLLLLSIIIGLTNMVAIGYIITQLIRVQAGVSDIKEK
jgi:hypothetical protein